MPTDSAAHPGRGRFFQPRLLRWCGVSIFGRMNGDNIGMPGFYCFVLICEFLAGQIRRVDFACFR